MADHDSMSSDSSGDEDYVPEGGSDSEGVCGSASEDEEGERSRTTLEGGRTKGRRKRLQKDKAPPLSRLTEEEARRVEEEEKEKIEKQEEKRIDDLWSSFKQDTNTKVLPSVATETSNCSQAAAKAPLKAVGRTVTVVKTYDFAGEEVKVSTEVPVDTKEGKRLLSEQQQEGSGSAEGDSACLSAKVEQAGQGGKGTPHSLGTKRGAGLSSVLAQISKKPKMTTLTKSKLDWDSYKKTQGLTDELAQGTKDGFLERKAFLERVDWREYELERQERSKHFKRLM